MYSLSPQSPERVRLPALAEPSLESIAECVSYSMEPRDQLIGVWWHKVNVSSVLCCVVAWLDL